VVELASHIALVHNRGVGLQGLLGPRLAGVVELLVLVVVMNVIFVLLNCILVGSVRGRNVCIPPCSICVRIFRSIRVLDLRRFPEGVN
jgi:hypothetical protein